MDKNTFINKLKENGIEISDTQMAQFDEYASFLKEYNEKINLTAITEYEEVLDKHFYDSLLLSFNKEIKGTLVDVGTGAGFPGVVLKIAFPELKVVLVEPIKKRCVFLQELIDRLGLKDIEVVNTRGEDFVVKHREEYDFVTARAVSALNVLIEVCGALVKKKGYFIALRGSSGLEEIKEANKAIKTMGFEVEETVEVELNDNSKRIISYFKKVESTPKKFPRQYSIIKQKSL
ncbi:MAG: 16S rRNA (guanine(527)-N(7))-methyltransferase RsmG [Erysipelotrichaceae bacterium]|nr:16S rRNA (guanine(527)-N(7))-methyltransferase RsmG [Erysipelotrichaceae bacterium]